MKTLIILGTACLALSATAQTPEAVKLTDKEQFEKATSAFKQLVAASPTSGADWFYFGENYYANDRSDSAAACYQRGIEVNSTFPLNHAGMGKVLREGGKADLAQAQFDQAVALATAKANKNSKQDIAATYREVAEGMLAGATPDYAGALGHGAKGHRPVSEGPRSLHLEG
jgi:tetratricopeptide (TPR) repeat protein